MKSVGIIGGIGPESTIEYYRLIIAAFREHKKDGSYPSIIINSIDMHRMLGLVRDGIDALILGGTELPLILTEPEHNGIPLLDTTRIHVERIVAELLS